MGNYQVATVAETPVKAPLDIFFVKADRNLVSASKLTVFVVSVAFRFRPKYKYIFRSTFGFGRK